MKSLGKCLLYERPIPHVRPHHPQPHFWLVKTISTIKRSLFHKDIKEISQSRQKTDGKAMPKSNEKALYVHNRYDEATDRAKKEGFVMIDHQRERRRQKIKFKMKAHRDSYGHTILSITNYGLNLNRRSVCRATMDGCLRIQSITMEESLWDMINDHNPSHLYVYWWLSYH